MLAPTTLAHTARTVVVIGGGLAGLSAAIQAASCGAAVTVLEKEARTGGNSAKASSGMNVALSPVQASLGIADSVAKFAADTLKAGKHKADPKLVNILAEQSVDAWSFLRGFGIELDEVSQCGGHTFPRTHREKELDGKPKAVGWDIMQALQTHVNTLTPITTYTLPTPNTESNTIRVITGAKVTKLVGEHARKVTGVQFDHAASATCHEMLVDNVILATGGYAADTDDLVKQHTPQYVNLATTNGKWATGDGVKLGLEFGALAADLDQVQIHPTGFVDPKDLTAMTKILAPESLRAYGSLLIDTTTSTRFVNELTTRDAVSQAMIHLSPENNNSSSSAFAPPTSILMVMNEFVVNSYGAGAVGFYQKRGLVSKFENLAALAEHYGLDLEVLEREVCVDESAPLPDRFGKAKIPTYFRANEVFYTALVTPVRHYTMGGLRITEQAQAMTAAHAPIANLFCCGEVSCGVDGYNRLAGNSLLSSVVYGRIAGKSSCGV
ncbi:hypothetical protein HDU98_003857 [Podochytrium sp. JEL0797]|nr:hypothetical protein HDU98_003857 [Podochytrium sp. JEL0797]